MDHLDCSFKYSWLASARILLMTLFFFFTDSCPICLETLKNPRTLKCKHVFCAQCLKKALAVNYKCPVCYEPQGVVQGNQPPGEMKSRFDRFQSVPGYEGIFMLCLSVLHHASGSLWTHTLAPKLAREFGLPFTLPKFGCLALNKGRLGKKNQLCIFLRGTKLLLVFILFNCPVFYLQITVQSSSSITFHLEFKARTILIPVCVLKVQNTLLIFQIHRKEERCCSY